MRNEFEPYDRPDERGYKKDAPPSNGVTKNKYAEASRAHSPDARPDRVGGTEWNLLQAAAE